MNYITHYTKLIERAKNRILDGYSEKHHIVPKCMAGTNDKNNLVYLTPEEHYIAHQLLIKIYPDNKELIYAAIMMCVYSETNDKRSNNKLFGWLRRRLATTACKNQTGNKNNQYGKCWIHNYSLRLSKLVIKEDLDKYIIKGWNVGRRIDFDRPLSVCCVCKNKFYTDDSRRKTCSKLCWKSHMSNIRPNRLSGREQEFLEKYKKYKSMNRTLKEMGFIGAVSDYYQWANSLIKQNNPAVV